MIKRHNMILLKKKENKIRSIFKKIPKYLKGSFFANVELRVYVCPTKLQSLG